MRAEQSSIRKDAVKGRVLVVDDEPDGLESAAAVLDERFEVAVAPSGAAALAGEPFQVVCVDYHMPGMTGAQLIARLATRSIPLVALLVSGERGDVLKHACAPSAHDDIVFSVLLKPYDPAHLLELVAKAERLAHLKQAMSLKGKSVGR